MIYKKRIINKVLEMLPRSGIRCVTEKAMSMSDEGQKVIHLGFGQPQEPPCEEIYEAVARAAHDGFMAYTENSGFPELKFSVVDKLRKKNNVEVDSAGIFVTPGATYGVAIVVGCLINPGDEVLVPDPGYPNFSAIVKHYGGGPRYYLLEEEKNYQPNLDLIRSKITSATKAIILNSPSNPTGSVLSRDILEQIIDFAREHDLWVISDEVYEDYVYGVPHVSPLSFPESDHVIGIYSFSKSYNMTGLRVGYIATRDGLLQNALLKAQELYISCAPSTSQIAAHYALTHCMNYIDKMNNVYQRKRDLVCALLGPYIKSVPDGAFYVLVDVGFTGLRSNEIADGLLENRQVAVVPGETFGPSGEKYIRLAYTTREDLLETGISRFKEYLNEISRKSSRSGHVVNYRFASTP